MISLKTIHRRSAAKATHYYADQKDDYYSRDGTAAQWQGKAGEALGLSGEIRQEDFLRALRGDLAQTSSSRDRSAWTPRRAQPWIRRSPLPRASASRLWSAKTPLSSKHTTAPSPTPWHSLKRNWFAHAKL